MDHHVTNSNQQSSQGGSPSRPDRRRLVKAAAKYAVYTGPLLLTLSMPKPAWASHDRGQQRSTT
jgi:hypothetical protein